MQKPLTIQAKCGLLMCWSWDRKLRPLFTCGGRQALLGPPRPDNLFYPPRSQDHPYPCQKIPSTASLWRKLFSSASFIKFDEILKFYSEANYPQPALNALRSLSHQRGTAECKTEAPHQKTSRFSCFLWDKIKKKLFSNGVLTLSIIEFRCDDLGEIWNVNCFVEICAMIGSSWQRKWNPATKMQRQFSFFKYV